MVYFSFPFRLPHFLDFFSHFRFPVFQFLIFYRQTKPFLLKNGEEKKVRDTLYPGSLPFFTKI